MAVSSLLQLARNACVKQAKAIKDVGDAPYELVRPILLKVENPRQLHTIEENSPQLKGHMEELWLEFIKRDIPFWRNVDLSESPESWYSLYCSLMEQAARELDLQAEQVKQVMDGLNSKKAQHCPKVVNARKLGLPQEKPTSLQKYANYDRQMGGLEPVFVLAPPPSEKGLTPYSKKERWAFEKPRLPPQTKPKKSVLPIVKRNNRLCIPTHQLNKRASAINKAPISFVQDYEYERRLAQRNATRKVPAARPAPQSREAASNFSMENASKTRLSQDKVKPATAPSIKRTTTLSVAARTPPTAGEQSPLDAPNQNVNSLTTNSGICNEKLLTPSKSTVAPSPKRRSPPTNPLRIPKKRPGPSALHMTSGLGSQRISKNHRIESGSDNAPMTNKAKQQRVS
ncbi:hypothetical protein PRK78_003357 [Emydomyces testavorans]|uniref:Elongin-A n=1 Tax=Emydomyces testavorans TaxID=2070801 RepID=A0AAF0DI52_9EURO|nr:hypothetical protein PRK78_003357 [Emydomyces testavorans]